MSCLKCWFSHIQLCSILFFFSVFGFERVKRMTFWNDEKENYWFNHLSTIKLDFLVSMNFHLTRWVRWWWFWTLILLVKVICDKEKTISPNLFFFFWIFLEVFLEYFFLNFKGFFRVFLLKGLKNKFLDKTSIIFMGFICDPWLFMGQAHG